MTSRKVSGNSPSHGCYRLNSFFIWSCLDASLEFKRLSLIFVDRAQDLRHGAHNAPRRRVVAGHYLHFDISQSTRDVLLYLRRKLLIEFRSGVPGGEYIFTPSSVCHG